MTDPRDPHDANLDADALTREFEALPENDSKAQRAYLERLRRIAQSLAIRVNAPPIPATDGDRRAENG